MDFRELPPVKEQLKKCVRCGRCRTVCPVFAEIKNETVAPRGHVFMVQMLRDGEVSPTTEVYDKLGNCLLCETCSTYCPSGIDIHELNEAARSYIYSQNPQTVKNLVFDTLWTRPGLMRAGGRLGWVATKTGLRKAARFLGLTRLLPGDMAKAETIIKDFPLQQARTFLPSVNRAQGEPRLKVGYFLGCGTDLFSPSVAQATVQVLTRAGCDVIIPKDIKCCGVPHVANGKMDTARNLAIHNIKLFNALDLDYIITDCASCSAALSEKRLQFLLNGQGYDKDIKAFSSKICDLTVFLTEIMELKSGILKPQEIKVTYHDPCHLAKAQGITKAPRDLLSSIPGLELIEMDDPLRCCGGSGTFSLTHYDMSMKILARKMDSIAATGANTIATCCPSCIMQLRHGTNLYHYPARVKHPIELVAAAQSHETSKLAANR